MDWRIEIAQHAAERAASAVHQEMARGIAALATVAATAPFLGMMGTVFGIFGSFRGVGTDKTTIMAAIAESLSEAIIPAALGLAVATVALVGYMYLRARMTDFDAEMRGAVRDMPAYLSGVMTP